MKAPAFLLYAGDFLSSPDVQAMDTREVGAYCLLLFNAWQGEHPGHLPNNEDRLRRLTKMSAAEWEVSRELLLSKFPVAENGLTRYNPRLLTEAEKQAENRRKKSIAGKRGGRPAKKQTESTEKQMLSEEKQMLSESKANDKQTESFSISISRLSDDSLPRAGEPSVEEVETSAVLVASASPPTARRPAEPDPDAPTFTADTWPGLVEPARFAAICQSLGYGQVESETYRMQISASLREAGKALPASSLRNFIQGWLNNDKRQNRLLLVPEAAQTPAERPSNFAGSGPYVPTTGSGIPNLSDILKPNWQPVAAQA